MSSTLSLLLLIQFTLIHAQTDGPIVIVGGYSEQDGIVFAKLNENDGSLTRISGPFNVGPNPSTITINQQDNYNMLYTVNEAGVNSALITAPFDPNNSYSIDTNNIISQSSYGYTPAYITTDINKNFVYVANYGANGKNSSFSVYKIDQLTGYLSNEPIVHKSFDQGNVVSHVHCILPNIHNSYNFYIADLGRDTVEHYLMSDNGNNRYSVELKSYVDFSLKSGPRTMAYHPVIDGIMYVSHEIDNKVSVVSFNINNYELFNIEQTLSTLPDNNSEYSACSHVQTDNNGKYVYIANRFTNNIASFTINQNNGLLLPNTLYINECGGEIPRYFNIDPTNNYMLICDQEGDKPNVATFKIDHQNDGHLQPLSKFDAVRPAWAFIKNET